MVERKEAVCASQHQSNAVPNRQKFGRRHVESKAMGSLHIARDVWVLASEGSMPLVNSKQQTKTRLPFSLGAKSAQVSAKNLRAFLAVSEQWLLTARTVVEIGLTWFPEP